MDRVLDSFRFRLLNEFQRDFPVLDRPFAALAERLVARERDVIETLSTLRAEGAITRVGATIRPNTAGASTLAAMSVPDDRLQDVTALLSAMPGVNHSYMREDAWNLWFVVTAPDAEALAADLNGIAANTGLRVLDLRLVRAFHIDLGFSLKRGEAKAVSAMAADLSALRETDRPLLQALSMGLPLVPEPYAELASTLGGSASELMHRILVLSAAGIITRLGIIVRHRQLGWTSNAMVVWDVPLAAVEEAGNSLAALPGVSLCYQRRTEPDVWPYALYNMVHARSRGEALAAISRAAALPQLQGAVHKILFSTQCFKQTGALLLRQEVAA